MELGHYKLIARMFDYPDKDFPKTIGDIETFLQEHYPQAASEVHLFEKNFPVSNLDKMQELFTRSFDVQAITTIDIGYVLFGDDYKRGELLANLNREHKKTRNNCGSELADHLPNILRLLTKLEDQELVNELVSDIIVPALEKMIAEFDPYQIEKKNKLYKKHYKTLIETPQNKATIYCHTLKALNLILRTDFDIQKQESLSEHSQDFLKSLGTEMVVEEIANE